MIMWKGLPVPNNPKPHVRYYHSVFDLQVEINHFRLESMLLEVISEINDFGLRFPRITKKDLITEYTMYKIINSQTKLNFSQVIHTCVCVSSRIFKEYEPHELEVMSLLTRNV